MDKDEQLENIRARFLLVLARARTLYKADQSNFAQLFSTDPQVSLPREFIELDRFIFEETKLNQMYGNRIQGGLIFPQAFIRPSVFVLRNYLLASPFARRFCPSKFAMVANNFLDSIETKKALTVYIAPLVGFTSSVNTIELGSGVQIRKLLDSEVSMLSRIDKIEELIGLSRNKFCICFTSTMLTLLEQHNSSQIREMFQSVLNCLHILKPNRVEVRLSYQYPKSLGAVTISPIVNHGRSETDYAYSESYLISQDDVNALRNLYHIEVSLKKHPNQKQNRIQMSRQRLVENHNEDQRDRFVNLVIAMDSMFGGGGDSLRYKVAIRSSFLLADAGSIRKEIYNVIYSAYAIRNNIVHGSSYDLNQLNSKLPELEKITRRAYIEFCHLFLRDGREIAFDRMDECIILGISM